MKPRAVIAILFNDIKTHRSSKNSLISIRHHEFHKSFSLQESFTALRASKRFLMDSKGSYLDGTSTFTEDSAHLQQALVDFKKEKCEEGIFIPGSFERENMDELDSMVAMMVADMASNEDASSPSTEEPTDYSTNSSWIYDAFKPVECIPIGSSEQSNHSFNMSSSDSSQLDPEFVQCHGLSEDVTQHYAPESTVAGNGISLAPTEDLSTHKFCSSSTSLTRSITKASSSSSQLFGEDASRKRELRLIKNRLAARESRRRKKEYIKHLEDHFAMLRLQNKALMEELNYLKKISADKQ